MSIKTFTKPLIIVAASTTLASGLGLYIYNEEHRPPVLEIYVFAPSSGRSMFIRTPEDKRILIDGGSNSEIIKELTSILPFYTRRIDMIMVTNIEGKNVSGLVDVVERYKVDQAFIPAFTLLGLGLASSSDQIYSTFIDTLSRENIKMEQVSTGKTIQLDSKTTLEILFPAEPSKFAYSKASAPEILFNLKYGSNSFTFMGNASNKVQKFIATSTFPTVSSTLSFSSTSSSATPSIKDDTDVLIISHSALPANMSPQLIEKLKPEYLVYSQKTTTSKSVTSKAKKKVMIDSLTYIPSEKKFNLKEKGRAKIVSDGAIIKIVQ